MITNNIYLNNTRFSYSKTTLRTLLLGFTLFLITEFLIFVALFASWIYSSVNPAIWLGAVWPPESLQTPQPLHLSFYCTAVLFLSSCSLIWCELSNQLRLLTAETFASLLFTDLTGIHFILIQILEFTRLPFSFTDTIYGTLFYTITGLHLCHILVGLGLLTSLYYRLGASLSLTIK